MQDINGYERFIGLLPGCYSMGVSHPETFVAGANLVLNSAEAPLTALTVYGHSTQSGTPSPENPVPIVSAGDEGEINVTVQGGNLVDIPDIPAGDGGLNKTIPVVISTPFVVSVDDSDIVIEGKAVWRLRFTFEDGSYVFILDGAFPQTINASPENKVVEIMYRDIRIESGTYKNFMLNAGSTPLPYMPYKKPQTLTVQTPGGLPGIPVSSGGNYTDENGQQWICDEVDFKRGKYVQRTMKYTFDGSDKQAWRRYSSGFYIADALEDGEYTRKPGLSNQFFVRSNTESTLPGLWIGINNSILYSVYNEFYDDSLPDFGLANWKAHLAAHPLEVMTYLETPIETDLSDEEMAAYKALHTYSPTTTVSNDAGAWMKVGYYGLTAIQKLEKEALMINGGKT